MASNKHTEILPHNGLVTMPLPRHEHAGVAPGKWLVGYLRTIPRVVLRSTEPAGYGTTRLILQPSGNVTAAI